VQVCYERSLIPGGDIRVSAPWPDKRLFPPAAAALRSDVLWVFQGAGRSDEQCLCPLVYGGGHEKSNLCSPLVIRMGGSPTGSKRRLIL
jgi:hypothetical protein